MTGTQSRHSVRPAAVAGLFYPEHPAVLRTAVEALLGSGVDIAREPEARAPKAIIVPHAGYSYSGEVAASAYRLLIAWGGSIERVVLLGPAHRVPLTGLAAPTTEMFETPLGQVRIDQAAIEGLADMAVVSRGDVAHQEEHSLEVQLPFLQLALAGFRLVPLVVGSASPDQVAAVLERLWGGVETLIVVSSDLSHYHSYPEAQELDSATSARILNLEPGLVGEQACGCYPVNGLLRVARERRMTLELKDLRNSGDTGGDKTSVVGYGAYAFYEE